MAPVLASSLMWRVKWRLPARVPLLLLISVLLLLAAAVALTLNLQRQHRSVTWVEHTNAVLTQIARVQRALLVAESSERAYLLTGEVTDRASSENAIAEMPGLLATLEMMIADNPAQTEHLVALRPHINARLDEIKRAVELGPARLQEALAALATAHSRQLTPRIEQGLTELRRVERNLLWQRLAEYEHVTVIVTRLAAALAALALLTAVAAGYYFERQRRVDQLRAANATMRAVLATVPDAMIIIDEEGIIRSFGAMAESLFGYAAAEVLGRRVEVLMPPLHGARHAGYIARYLATSEKRAIGVGRVVVGQRKDGSNFPLEIAVGEISAEGKRQFVGFIRDLTERQERDRLFSELQSELLHVTRLTNMGELASGLAHELNQPLAALNNYLRGAQRLLADRADARDDMLRTALGNASTQALRAGQVIRRLRDFLARGETERRVESIRPMIDEAAALALVGLRDKPVQLRVNIDPSVERVLVDKVQIQQVLLNLMRNGIEAMASAERRELTISTHRDGRDMVAVSVADTGSGIDPAVLPKLFQPFVSTKSRGMGIGLSLCRTIVQAHGGEIAAQPNPGGGTIFRFTLQSAPAEAEPAEEIREG